MMSSKMKCVAAISFLLLSFYHSTAASEKSPERRRHLFVHQRGPVRGSSLPIREIHLAQDGSVDVQDEPLADADDGDSKRAPRQRRSVTNLPTNTLHQFNDSHNMLLVQWSGFNNSDTMVVLSRDSTSHAKSTSYLYVSNNYGRTFMNQSEKLVYTNGSTKQYALIDRVRNSPINGKKYIFTDVTHNVLFYSTDDCETLNYVPLDFKPVDITFHPSKESSILAYDETAKTLHYSRNFGKTWAKREDNVKGYNWGVVNSDSTDTIYIEIMNGTKKSNVVRGHYDHRHFRKQRVISDVTDFEIQGNYMFATKENGTGFDLYVSLHYHNFEKAIFPINSENQDYIIADASEGQVFVAVNHNRNTSHLYISDTTGKKYSLSLERVLYYNPNYYKDTWLRRYMNESFIDFHRVAALRGIYIASQVSVGKVGTRFIYTMITHDMGDWWTRLRSPRYHYDGSSVNCSYWLHSCSLHLVGNYAANSPYHYAPPIKSKSSAPGLIMASGNLGKNLKYSVNTYLSNNAGDTWMEVLQGRYYYNFGDHGGVIIAVPQWTPTTQLRYSIDEGVTWNTYNFSSIAIRVYGLLTEPGEKTTIFSLWGSFKLGRHRWIVLKVDFSKVLGAPCKESDYETWSPQGDYPYGRCLLGEKLVFERRKRYSVCYNGRNYDRPVSRSTCYCRWNDFECDVGFMHGYWSCDVDPNASFNPYAAPRPCPRGSTYNRTRGYRKIIGDKCVNGSEQWYLPYEESCPFQLEKAFLVYARRDKINYYDLVTGNHTTTITGLRGAVAVAYDLKDGYIFWADMIDHKIFRQTLNQTDERIVIAGIKQIEGMAIDWTTDNLYWVDSKEKVIEVCRKDGLFRKTIHNADLDKPRAIALDPPNAYMYWCDWGSHPKIERSWMDGTHREVLIHTKITWPNGLALDIFNKDKTKRVLYWTDAKLDKIEKYDIATKTRTVFAARATPKFYNVLAHPYSIAVDDRDVYWDDWVTGALYKIAKSGQGKPIVLVKGEKVSYAAKKMYEIKVIYNRTQTGSSKCSGHSCAQVCLPKPGGFNCTCADGMYKDARKQCHCLGHLHLYANGTCARKRGQHCARGEFACKTTRRCITNFQVCDAVDDCGDGSDEFNCSGICRCRKNQYCCENGDCISRKFVCDGEKNCRNGEDETDCGHIVCKFREFKCKKIEQCIPSEKRCDGYVDCKDKTDEESCQNQTKGCPSVRDFRCGDGSCVVASARCNNVANCPDHSDEMNCAPSCAKGQFACKDKSRCIPESMHCDGKKDCLFDGSDEVNCPHTSTPTATTGHHGHTTTASPAQTTSGNHTKPTENASAQKSSKSKKSVLMWAIPVAVVFAIMLIALIYFAVKSRRLQRSFYHLIRSDSFDGGVAYHNAGDEDDVPLIQGFSDDDPLVEA